MPSIGRKSFERLALTALVVLFVCLLAFLWLCATPSSVAYADGKIPYAFNMSLLSYRRNATAVALYYDGEFDENVMCVLVDAEGTRTDLFDLGAFGAPVIEGNANLFLLREEDDVYESYQSEAIPLEVNTAMEVVILPYGQRRAYDGTETTYEIGIFKQNGSLAHALHAGEYDLTLEYEEPVSVSYVIDKGIVRATPQDYSRRYLEAGQPTEITVTGGLIESELSYVKDNLVLTCSAQEDSVPGEYDITLTYNGLSDDYDVLLDTAVCTIRGALLKGFAFEEEESSCVYDGKSHSLEVSYDKTKWSDVTITYNIEGVKDPGRYRITATVRKEHYDDLILRATLIVRATQIETSSLTEYACIEGAEEGFDPAVSILLSPFEYDEEDEEIAAALAEKDGYKGTVISSYSVVFSEYVEGTLTLKMRPSVPQTDSGVILLQVKGDGSVETVDYTYENGYFIVETDYFDGFMFIRKVHVTHTSMSDIIVAAAVGAVILLVILIVLGAISGSAKKNKRSRRRHARWA